MTGRMKRMKKKKGEGGEGNGKGLLGGILTKLTGDTPNTKDDMKLLKASIKELVGTFFSSVNKK